MSEYPDNPAVCVERVPSESSDADAENGFPMSSTEPSSDANQSIHAAVTSPSISASGFPPRYTTKYFAMSLLLVRLRRRNRSSPGAGESTVNLLARRVTLRTQRRRAAFTLAQRLRPRSRNMRRVSMLLLA